VDPAVQVFVGACAKYAAFRVRTSNPAYTANWGQLGKNAIRAKCDRIARTRPARVRSMREEMFALSKYFHNVNVTPTTTTIPPTTIPSTPPPTTVAPPPPPTLPHRPTGLPPSISVDCGPPVAGDWDWYHKSFGSRWMSWLPIVEWGMDYGDGNQYAAHDEASARQDVFWHEYQSPGSYPVRAWVIDSAGRRADATCMFTWMDGGSPNPSPETGSPDLPSGDLDCEDIGHQVWVGNYDPNGLDGDGDGWGCDGW
jgi:hypothetical protein